MKAKAKDVEDVLKAAPCQFSNSVLGAPIDDVMEALQSGQRDGYRHVVVTLWDDATKTSQAVVLELARKRHGIVILQTVTLADRLAIAHRLAEGLPG